LSRKTPHFITPAKPFPSSSKREAGVYPGSLKSRPGETGSVLFYESAFPHACKEAPGKLLLDSQRRGNDEQEAVSWFLVLPSS
jgi:hypothetical protein